MVRPFTVEMLEHSAHSTPDVKAHVDLFNGALVGITYTGTSKVTKAPSTSDEIYVILNAQRGDDSYALTYPIAKDDFCDCYKVSEWKGKQLIVTKENIVDATVAVGDVLVADASTFKFKKGSATTGSVSFTVMELDATGVKVLIK